MFKRKIKILVASRNEGIPAALAAAAPGRVQPVEAISTGVAYANLQGCALAIVDIDDLIVSPEVSREMLGRTLVQSGIQAVRSFEFIANPTNWLGQAAVSVGQMDMLAPCRVMLTGYSGGTGKTTLSLNLARYVTGQLHLPAVVVEVTSGVSSIQALTDPAMPDLYDVLTQNSRIGSWESISLLPMNYSSARLLLNRVDDVRALLKELSILHVVTIVDAHGTNPFCNIFQAEMDLILVVSDPRLDAVANGFDMIETIRQAGHVPVSGVINKMNALGDRLALSHIKMQPLPLVGRPECDPRLAELLLPMIYPGWKRKKA